MFANHVAPLTGTLVQIADGRAGIMQTVRAMRAAVDRGKVDLSIRQSAINIIRLVPPKDTLGEIDALFSFVQRRIRYTGDICGVETLSEAATTLQIEAGDCDDVSILLASLLESVGIQTKFIIEAYQMAGQFEHVYVGAVYGDAIVGLDATEQNAAGWTPPNAVTTWIEP